MDVRITPGSHASEEAVNKQLNDKERVAAALENSNLLKVVNQCLIEQSWPPRLSITESQNTTISSDVYTSDWYNYDVTKWENIWEQLLFQEILTRMQLHVLVYVEQGVTDKQVHGMFV